MFKNIYVEQAVESSIYAQNLINHFNSPVKTIDSIDNYWGRAKKPYLQKRDNLNLYIGEKKGQLVKKTPDAYGSGDGDHYYFIHAYNCIYECEYCYLQGYFHTPDIVLYVNHEEIRQQMNTLISEEEVWFHAGEFSDSLALSHITGEWEKYWDFFKKRPNAKLELRTKSANIKSIINLEPLENIIVSFSLSPEVEVREYDRKTASLKARLKAIEQLNDKRFKIGLHFDPVIYHEDYEERYDDLFEEVFKVIDSQNLAYISLGVVRFPQKIYSQMKKNYPQSKLLAQEFVTDDSGMVKYSRPMRMKILKTLREKLLALNTDESKIYLCMEN